MRYFGKYLRFETESKEQGMVLLNADNLVGDPFSIQFEVEDGITKAWLVNKFDKKVGYFEKNETYQLDVLRGRGWNLHAILSEVMYTEKEEAGEYWGEVAVIANPDRYEKEILSYIKQVGGRMAEGFRPKVDLTEPQIDTMLEKKGEWYSPDNIPARSKVKGTARVKANQSLSEKMIEQGRAGNPGCYAASYAFIALLVVGACALIAKLIGLF